MLEEIHSEFQIGKIPEGAIGLSLKQPSVIPNKGLWGISFSLNQAMIYSGSYPNGKTLKCLCGYNVLSWLFPILK